LTVALTATVGSSARVGLLLLRGSLLLLLLLLLWSSTVEGARDVIDS
jgi:hypothetical protein